MPKAETTITLTFTPTVATRSRALAVIVANSKRHGIAQFVLRGKGKQ